MNWIGHSKVLDVDGFRPKATFMNVTFQVMSITSTWSSHSLTGVPGPSATEPDPIDGLRQERVLSKALVEDIGDVRRAIPAVMYTMR